MLRVGSEGLALGSSTEYWHSVAASATDDEKLVLRPRPDLTRETES